MADDDPQRLPEELNLTTEARANCDDCNWPGLRGPTVVNSQEDKVEKMYVDFYQGEGKDNPSITTRMAMVEDRTERLERNLTKALWLAVATLLTVGGELLLRFVVK